MSIFSVEKLSLTNNFVISASVIFLSLIFSSESNAQQIEEIVVTAEKRVASLQETPISITVFSGDELSDSGITNSEQLSYYTPGLVIQRQVIGKVTMRGVGNENLTIGGDPSVAFRWNLCS